MLRQRMPREHNEKHLAFIRQLPCVVCCEKTHTEEAAHIRMADPSVGKPQTGMQEKPDDKFTVPLCNRHHREQHEIPEFNFWTWAKIDPVKTALALYSVTGDSARGEAIVSACREQRAA